MNILQIGAGGIGSYLAELLFKLYRDGVQGTENMNLTIIDDDKVEEKNLRYQNFEIKELEEYKARALSNRYFFNSVNKRVEKDEDIANFNLIVLAVDNGKVRKLVYEYCDKNPTTKYIDLRSEGTAIAFYTSNKSNDLATMLKTIDADAPSTSCQLKFELEQGKIQQGNKIIASIGSQLILNELREEPNIARYNFRF